jgi:hypothetical protein
VARANGEKERKNAQGWRAYAINKFHGAAIIDAQPVLNLTERRKNLPAAAAMVK